MILEVIDTQRLDKFIGQYTYILDLLLLSFC